MQYYLMVWAMRNNKEISCTQMLTYNGINHLQCVHYEAIKESPSKALSTLSKPITSRQGDN